MAVQKISKFSKDKKYETRDGNIKLAYVATAASGVAVWEVTGGAAALGEVFSSNGDGSSRYCIPNLDVIEVPPPPPLPCEDVRYSFTRRGCFGELQARVTESFSEVGNAFDALSAAKRNGLSPSQLVTVLYPRV